MTYHNTAFANANIGSSWAIDPEFRLSMGAHTAVLGYLRMHLGAPHIYVRRLVL